MSCMKCCPPKLIDDDVAVKIHFAHCKQRINISNQFKTLQKTSILGSMSYCFERYLLVLFLPRKFHNSKDDTESVNYIPHRHLSLYCAHFCSARNLHDFNSGYLSLKPSESTDFYRPT